MWKRKRNQTKANCKNMSWELKSTATRSYRFPAFWIIIISKKSIYYSRLVSLYMRPGTHHFELLHWIYLKAEYGACILSPASPPVTMLRWHSPESLYQSLLWTLCNLISSTCTFQGGGSEIPGKVCELPETEKSFKGPFPWTQLGFSGHEGLLPSLCHSVPPTSPSLPSEKWQILPTPCSEFS